MVTPLGPENDDLDPRFYDGQAIVSPTDELEKYPTGMVTPLGLENDDLDPRFYDGQASVSPVDESENVPPHPELQNATCPQHQLR